MDKSNLGLIYFLLILLRISGIFFITPIFSSEAINKKTKLGFSLFITILIYNLVPKVSGLTINSFTLTGMVIKELLIGAIIGYLIAIVFSIVQTASQIYSMNMGLMMASVFDPIAKAQIPVLGQMNNLFMMGIFFIYGIHRKFLEVLINTFYVYPIADFNFKITSILNFFKINFSYYFVLAIELALPILAVLFLIDVVLGIMARIAPQMNVFFIGMPLKLLVGFLVLINFAPYYIKYIAVIFDGMIEKIIKLLEVGLN